MKLQQSQQKCLQTIHGSEILMQIGTENQRLPTKATITNPRYHLGDPLRPKISNTRTVWKCKKWGGGGGPGTNNRLLLCACFAHACSRPSCSFPPLRFTSTTKSSNASCQKSRTKIAQSCIPRCWRRRMVVVCVLTSVCLLPPLRFTSADGCSSRCYQETKQNC
jgi:hypothetical protein